MMKKYVFIAGMAIAGCMFVALDAGRAASDEKSQALNLGLMDIQTTEQAIRRKAELAENLRQGFRQQIDELKSEVNQERQHVSAKELPHALQSARIDYDLRLIQMLFAHIERLDDRIAYLSSAVQALDFYRRQIQDDLLFLRTLNQADIAGLMHRLAADIKRFTDQAENPLPFVSKPGPRPLEAIWKDILQGR